MVICLWGELLRLLPVQNPLNDFLLRQRCVQVKHSDYCQMMVLISPSWTGTDGPLHLLTNFPNSCLRQSGKALQGLKLQQVSTL